VVELVQLVLEVGVVKVVAVDSVLVTVELVPVTVMLEVVVPSS
jgi:hypothetical protein